MPDRREYHAHIFDGFQDGSLGVCLLFDTRREWTKAKKDLLAEGFRLKQDAHTEGTLLFDPTNEAHVWQQSKRAVYAGVLSQKPRKQGLPEAVWR